MMKKLSIKNASRFLSLIVIALLSGYEQSIITDSPTSTPTLSQPPTKSTTPSPTTTLEPIKPDGTLIYSDFHNIYSVELQNQKVNSFSVTSHLKTEMFLVQNTIYISGISKIADKKANQTLDDVLRISLNGKIIEQITSNGSELMGVASNGAYLIYAGGDIKTHKTSLVLYDINQKTRQTIALEKDYYLYWLSWSPDSKRVLYFERRNQPPFTSTDYDRLFLYNLDENKNKELFPGSFVSLTSNPWSPDGKQFLFNIKEGRKTNTYILNVENSNKYKIPISDQFVDGSLDWSPNGKHIALSVWNGENSVIYIFDTKSSNLDKIASYDSISNLTWSPNGDKLLFQEYDRGSDTSETSLHMLDITNKQITNIQTQKGILLPGANGLTIDRWAWNYSPLWSPNGKFFAYFTTPNPDNYQESRRLVLNIHYIGANGYIEFEVPPIDSPWLISTPYWIYNKQ